MATREQFRADRGIGARETVERGTAERRSSAEKRATETASPELAPDPVTPEQRWLVQNSWEKVVPMAPHVAELFFDRLFELDPFLEDLFPSDLSKLGAEWMRALGLAAPRLEEPSSAAPCLAALSRMHVDVGVRPGHYVTMGNALLWTLEQSLAEDFTPRVKEAWGAAYQLISALMIQADAAAVLTAIRPADSQKPGTESPAPPGSARRPVDAVPRDAVPRDAVPRDAVPLAARRAV
jgi:hemoglobin-like flavoprotein